MVNLIHESVTGLPPIIGTAAYDQVTFTSAPVTPVPSCMIRESAHSSWRAELHGLGRWNQDRT